MRFFNGYVTRFAQTGMRGRYHHYQAIVHPWLWFLQRTSNCRIFQGATVPDILKQIFDDHPAIANVKKELKGAHEAEEVAKVAKLAKEAKDAARLKKAEGEAAAGSSGSKPPGGGKKVKPKKKLKCGEYGKYGDLKKKTGDGKFDRDHIPSKAALKEKALELNGGVPLTAAQKKAIDNWGNSIAIPRQAHIDVSPTHGTKNIKLAPKDATDLAGAARRDVNAMLKKIDEYDADGGCKKAYQKSAKKVLEMSNKDFNKALQGIIDKVK